MTVRLSGGEAGDVGGSLCFELHSEGGGSEGGGRPAWLARLLLASDGEKSVH